MLQRRIVHTLLIGSFLIGGVQNANGQLLKNLKKKMEQKLEKKADEKTDQLLNGKGEKEDDQKLVHKQANTASKNQNTKDSTNTLERNEVAVNDANIITCKAPSENFTDIVIQSHNGLPRFGDLYFRRNVTAPTNNKGYQSLLELKYLTDVYADMDRTTLTKGSRNSSEQNASVKHSIFAQRHLFNILANIGSEKLLIKYACDSESGTNCEFFGRYGDRILPNTWGGNQQNQFQQMRSYTGFVKNHLEELQTWAATFFKNGYEVAYYVDRGWINAKYDFKKKGYWVSNLKHSTRGFLIHPSNFLAYTSGEKLLKNDSELIFLPMSPTKAKTLQLEERQIKGKISVYTVFKVKVRYREPGQDKTNVQFEYELENSKIELFKDIALTEKIGELDTNNLIVK
ncbi:hypothetical protein [Maribacter sp. 2210JD10-5]|uniref:hypothetical protein n=1 Tax=Maribacter sp. 2210JD10-5 TaxID=3386272 RepID=UPI0039BCD682